MTKLMTNGPFLLVEFSSGTLSSEWLNAEVVTLFIENDGMGNNVSTACFAATEDEYVRAVKTTDVIALVMFDLLLPFVFS